MFYREAAPADILKPFILSFWELLVPEGEPSPISHEVFPDGCVSVFYFRSQSRGVDRLAITGIRVESIAKSVSAGDIFWGMRIAPAACRDVLRQDPRQLVGRAVADIAEFPHLTDRLLERLSAASNFDEAVEVFESVIKSLSGSLSLDSKVGEAVSLIDQYSGEVRIDDLARQLGLSPRQLQRRFKVCTGLSPKQFARVRRFRATAVIVAETKNINWADRAAEMGFADQSHLSHEFVSVTKRSPKSFAEKFSEIEHGNLVK